MPSLHRTLLLSALVILAIAAAFFSLQFLRASVVDDPQGFIRTRLSLTNNQCPTLTQKIIFWNDLIGAKMTNDLAFDANGNGKVTVTDASLLSTAMVGIEWCGGTNTILRPDGVFLSMGIPRYNWRIQPDGAAFADVINESALAPDATTFIEAVNGSSTQIAQAIETVTLSDLPQGFGTLGSVSVRLAFQSGGDWTTAVFPLDLPVERNDPALWADAMLRISVTACNCSLVSHCETCVSPYHLILSLYDSTQLIDTAVIPLDNLSVRVSALEVLLKPEEVVCGDGIPKGEEECDDGNRTDADQCSNFCKLRAQKVFVQSTNNQISTLNGLIGADALCQNAAASAGLLGNWQAILSDSTTNAYDRINIYGPVANMKNQIIASNKADFWNGPLAGPIGYSQGGADFGTDILSATTVNGQKMPGTSIDFCGDWTSDNGRTAYLPSGNAKWWNYSDWMVNTSGNKKWYTCTDWAHLYCLQTKECLTNDECGEQRCVDNICRDPDLTNCGNGTPDPGEECDNGPENSDEEANACRSDCLLAHCGDDIQDTDEECDDGNHAGGDSCDSSCRIEFDHKIFVTSQSFAADMGGLNGADTKCQTLAEQAGLAGAWKAVLSDSLRSVRGRISLRGKVVNMKNETVSGRADDFWMEDHGAAIKYDENGNLRETMVRTASYASGQMAYVTWEKACNNWGSRLPSPEPLRVGLSNAMNRSWTRSNSEINCGDAAALYCIQESREL